MEPDPQRLRRVDQIDELAVARWLERTRRLFPDATVFLFGSRARGEAWAESDYDFCVISQGFAGEKPWDRAERLVELWELPIAIEVVAYTPEEWEADLCVAPPRNTPGMPASALLDLDAHCAL